MGARVLFQEVKTRLLRVTTLILNGTQVTTTGVELNELHDQAAVAADFAKLHAITATAAEINAVDNATAGTVVASKAVVVDANKDVSGFRNLTATALKAGTNGAGGAAGSVVVRDGANPGAEATMAYADVEKVAAITASANELNAASDQTVQNADGFHPIQIARATYDFAEHAGAIGAIGLGITLPDKAVVVGGFVDVITTCQTEGADAGTMALSVESANDIVAAIAVSEGTNPWDAGLHAIVPKSNTPETTGVKLTAAREITATIGGQAFTAGKFVVFLHFVVSD
jgi:hypothetical protein